MYFDMQFPDTQHLCFLVACESIFLSIIFILFAHPEWAIIVRAEGEALRIAYF